MNNTTLKKDMKDARENVLAYCDNGETLTHHGDWLIDLISQVEHGETPVIDSEDSGLIPDPLSQYCRFYYYDGICEVCGEDAVEYWDSILINDEAVIVCEDCQLTERK